ncbi:hypothetical protein NHX12_034511 [Muraenolepis orangiensis]|uniref:Uncharacterized protein n=1 Tax=Muraenolepis orangiensis TaxID=630683 RepID=A0A9Q0D8D8_9TELE|nr:hypothetical protein NHX12_034511 [Muraenolepis orangiensis]
MGQPDHLKRKVRRRPFWGRGIIRKKKTYKKGIEEEEEEEEEEAEGDTTGDTTGPCDSFLLQDEESSCDTTGPAQANGHHAASQGPSTEEENSNEPLVATPTAPPLPADQPPTPGVQPKAEEPGSGGGPESQDTEENSGLQSLGPTGGGVSQSEPRAEPEPEADTPSLGTEPKDEEESRTSGAECVNGDESMDSLDSSVPAKSCGDGERTGETRPKARPNRSRKSQASRRRPEKLWCFRPRKEARKTLQRRAQIQKTALKKALLGVLVQKSEGFSVDQLERLYSHLSQCIYRHRRDYDKTRLLEDMEERVQHFDTFL